MKKFQVRNIIIIITFVLFGVITRTFLHIAPNVEFVTGLTIVGAYLVKRKYSILIPIGIMLVSDWMIGNSAIFLFTWSAYIIGVVFGKLLSQDWFKNRSIKLPKIFKLPLTSAVAGVFFTFFFFLWTNFGVVLVSELYPKTIAGVIQSYIMGLPFLWPQLLGNIIILPAISLIGYFVFEKNSKYFNKLGGGTILKDK